MTPTAVIHGPKVLGVDLSITCTGLAGPGWTDTIKPAKKGVIHARMDTIVSALVDEYLQGVDLVVLEGLAMAAHDTNRQGAGLNWIVRRELWKRGAPFASVPPATLKQFACGKGNADKAAMVLATARRFDWFAGGEDESDAVWLMAAGREWLGAPVVVLPQVQRAVLARVEWPDMLAVAA
jgi:hypothetical protein